MSEEIHRCSMVHCCDIAQQPDIHILCDDLWTTPMWESARKRELLSEGVPGVYVTDSEHVYTFEDGKVTCPACLELMK